MKKLYFFIPLLFFAFSLFAQTTLSVEKTVFAVGEDVQIQYANAPVGAKIYLYHNAGVVPLGIYLTTTEESGTMYVGNTLEQGKYTAIVTNEGQNYAQTSFRVQDLPLEKSDVHIFVMSDNHIMSPELVMSDGSAYQNMLSANRKILERSVELTEALIDTILRLKPDMVFIPGDMTKDGERLSHELFVSYLDRLRENGIPAYVVPGNHDLNNTASYFYDGDKRIEAPSVNEEEYMQLYKSYGYADEYQIDTASLTYVCEPADDIMLIGIDVARGVLSDATLKWICDRADEAAEEGKMVVAMMHYQLLQHFENEELVFPSASIQSGDSIAAVMLEHGIRVVLTGHMHINNISKFYNPVKSDSIIEISTGSPIEYPSCWRWLTINKERNNITVNTRYVNEDAIGEDLLIYERNHLAEHADPIIVNAVNSFWGMRDQLEELLNKQMITIPGGIPLPETKEEMIALSKTYLKEPMLHIAYVASEANENLKNGDLIKQELVDAMVELCIVSKYGEDYSSNTNPITQIMINGTKQGLAVMLNMYLPQNLNSLLTDCSYCSDEVRANQTNDLYLSLDLPTPKKVETAVSVKQTDNNDKEWYDVLGRKVSGENLQKGRVYIQKGKKVILY